MSAATATATGAPQRVSSPSPVRRRGRPSKKQETVGVLPATTTATGVSPAKTVEELTTTIQELTAANTKLKEEQGLSRNTKLLVVAGVVAAIYVCYVGGFYIATGSMMKGCELAVQSVATHFQCSLIAQEKNWPERICQEAVLQG